MPTQSLSGCVCRLRWCNTDLGANVLSWPSLTQENKRFSQLAPVACGLPAENYDGVLAQHLMDCNWTVHHVTDKCLYDHSPSPQVRTPLTAQGIKLLSASVNFIETHPLCLQVSCDRCFCADVAALSARGDLALQTSSTSQCRSCKKHTYVV